MTGFAEKRFHSRMFSGKINIRTLNHRFFDWNYRGFPVRELESKLRAICQKKISRGRVDVFVDIYFLDRDKLDVRFNEELLIKVLSTLEKISRKMDKKMDISLGNLLSIPQFVEFQQRDLTPEEIAFLEKNFEQSLDEVLKEKVREGKEIGKNIRSHLQNTRRYVAHLEKRAKKQPLLIQKKLKERLKGLGQETSLPQDKLAEEVAFLAQRADLTEEIARLKGHILYFFDLLSPKLKEAVGKKMDFLAQELHREANTLNAKAADLEIVREGVSLKSEIESIRQQVQNLE